jgi:hypothetical protein
MPVGAADEHDVDLAQIEPVLDQRVGPLAVDAAVQELDVLRLARQHVDEIEARQVDVLERGQLLLEHHGARRTIAVEQRESRMGSAARVVLMIDSSGVMPLPCREGNVMLAMAGVERHPEVTERRQYVERIARLEPLVGPGREEAARIALDRDAQRTVSRAGTDRIRAADILPLDVGAQREMLSRRHGETIPRACRAPRA